MNVMRWAVGWASLAATVLCAPMHRSAAEPITLRLHTFNSPKAIVNQLFLEPWAREVEARSSGRVTVQVFPAMQLGGKPADLYGQAQPGHAWRRPRLSATKQAQVHTQAGRNPDALAGNVDSRRAVSGDSRSQFGAPRIRAHRLVGAADDSEQSSPVPNSGPTRSSIDS